MCLFHEAHAAHMEDKFQGPNKMLQARYIINGLHIFLHIQFVFIFALSKVARRFMKCMCTKYLNVTQEKKTFEKSYILF